MEIVFFVARRAINTKLFHYPDNVEKPVYGAHLIDDSVKELYVCESAINALTCWVYGKKAVALLGLGTKYQYDILKKLPVRKNNYCNGWRFCWNASNRAIKKRTEKIVEN